MALAAVGTAVVGPGGIAAGGGYVYWLGVKNRLFFDTPAPGPPVCATEHGPAGPIAFLLGGGRERHSFSCHEPAGRPIYVNGLNNECSTLKGDHNGYGTSDAQLRRCARSGYRGLSASATLDGRRVANYHELIATSPPITFHIRTNNSLGIAPQSGRSVSYGEGLLLSGLSVGTHNIRISEKFPPPNQSNNNTVIYAVHIT
jgi:hypothetical protein